MEDFGTPVNTQPEVIYDPLDDIADVSNPPTLLPDGVELFETVSTEEPSNGNQRLYDKTTIAYPFEDGNENLKIPMEAVEVEKEMDENVNDAGLLINTTTPLPPIGLVSLLMFRTVTLLISL